MLRRYRPTITIVVGFLLGLVLATVDKVFPPRGATGPIAVIAVIVDWSAPPLAGALVAAALLVAQRYKRLHDAERAASKILAERLTGTERRQALWVVAAAIAHDLKNPLHNLQLLMEELDEESNPIRRAELIARLRENVDRASSRVSELSRAGRAPEEMPEPVDLATALQELQKRVTSAARLSGTEVTVECPRGLAVRADALAVRSAVENVVANALEALQQNGSGGRLVVRARSVDGVVELVVEDNGPGIPEEVRSRLFMPFASGRESTGLGLAIARALARASGGELTCTDPRPGHTCFRFTFQGPGGSFSDQRRLPSTPSTERMDV
ncbi:MAG TPA: HAMP domain-containing sensor histidine kinase [Myxococcales bacterium]|nr:HAMP domain-containing sensor histidine kinase [Myxococcales bacterium]